MANENDPNATRTGTRVTGTEPLVKDGDAGGVAMVGGIPAQPAPAGARTGTVMQPANQPMRQPGEDVSNPLGEKTIRVRVRPGAEFYAQFANGELVREGEEYDAPISMARAASIYLEEITPEGTTRAIPHEQQQIGGMPERAQLAGRPAHERVTALEEEKARLEERLKSVDEQLSFERKKAESDQAEATKRSIAVNAPAQPASDVVQADIRNTNVNRPEDSGTTFAQAPGPGRR